MFCNLSHRLIEVKVKSYEILTYIAFSVPLEVHYSKLDFIILFLMVSLVLGVKKGSLNFRGMNSLSHLTMVYWSI